MNETPSDFEQQLKRLQPITCDRLQPDAFYRAGWQAAEQARTLQASSKIQRRQRAATFATGLLCGLLVSVGLAAWQLSVQHPSDRQTPPVVVTPHSADRPSAATPDQPESPAETETSGNVTPPAAIASQSPDRWDELISGFTPWRRPAPMNAEPKTAAAVRPLSPAARHYWSSVVVSGPHTGPAEREEHAAGSHEDRSPLRSFPATQRVLDELL